MLMLSSAEFFKNNFSKKKSFMEHYQGAKQLGSRSGPTLYRF